MPGVTKSSFNEVDFINPCLDFRILWDANIFRVKTRRRYDKPSIIDNIQIIEDDITQVQKP